MLVLVVWGKYYCVYIVVIDLRCILNLLWGYPVPDKSDLLIVLLDSACNFSYLPAIGGQDLWLSYQETPSVSHSIGKSFICFQEIVNHIL